MLTRCTECRTPLRITAKDLQAGRGWVRCGFCRQGFDALVHLRDDPAAAGPPDADGLPELTEAARAGSDDLFAAADPLAAASGPPADVTPPGAGAASQGVPDRAPGTAEAPAGLVAEPAGDAQAANAPAPPAASSGVVDGMEPDPLADTLPPMARDTEDDVEDADNPDAAAGLDGFASTPGTPAPEAGATTAYPAAGAADMASAPDTPAADAGASEWSPRVRDSDDDPDTAVARAGFPAPPDPDADPDADDLPPLLPPEATASAADAAPPDSTDDPDAAAGLDGFASTPGTPALEAGATTAYPAAGVDAIAAVPGTTAAHAGAPAGEETGVAALARYRFTPLPANASLLPPDARAPEPDRYPFPAADGQTTAPVPDADPAVDAAGHYPFADERPPVLEPARRDPGGWGWGLVALVLLLALAAQAVRHHGDALVAAAPATAPMVAALCRLLPCRAVATPATTDSLSLRMLARDVREHPRYQNTLLVNASLVNESQRVVAFPTLTLRLFDETGAILGARDFAPAEYLDDSIDRQAGMAPEVPVYVTLEIAGSLEQAVSFEFAFR